MDAAALGLVFTGGVVLSFGLAKGLLATVFTVAHIRPRPAEQPAAAERR